MKEKDSEKVKSGYHTDFGVPRTSAHPRIPHPEMTGRCLLSVRVINRNDGLL